MSIDDLLASADVRLSEVENEMTSLEVQNDRQRMAELAREHRRLRELVEARGRLERARRQVADLREAAADPELIEIAQSELPEAEASLARLERQVKTLVLPEPQEDSRNAVLEIRAGTGGEEAALFGADLLKM